MCDVFLPDMFVDVPGPLQDVGQCEAGGSDTADDGPSHNVIGVVGQVVQVGLEKITNLTQIIKVHILWFVIPSSKMLTKIINFFFFNKEVLQKKYGVYFSLWIKVV